MIIGVPTTDTRAMLARVHLEAQQRRFDDGPIAGLVQSAAHAADVMQVLANTFDDEPANSALVERAADLRSAIDAVARYQQLKQAGLIVELQWHRVSDGLPTFWDDCLLHKANGVDIGFLTDTNEWVTEDETDPLGAVTHWAELPNVVIP